jgi:3-hydroxyacyl-[acyl-carrier-protein] dehydratase
VQTSRWTGLDRIVELESGKRACGFRNIPNTLSILDSHFPRMPVLPGVLMLGSMGELAARLLQEHTGRTWRLAGADQVRFRHFVQPGDQLEFEVELKDVSDTAAGLSATARVEGKVMVTARRLRMVPDAGGPNA